METHSRDLERKAESLPNGPVSGGGVHGNGLTIEVLRSVLRGVLNVSSLIMSSPWTIMYKMKNNNYILFNIVKMKWYGCMTVSPATCPPHPTSPL